MAISLFPKNMRKMSASKLDSMSIKGFSGGWNAVHDDLSMDPRYLVRALNVVRTPSGAHMVRYGNKWFVDLRDVVAGTRIVDMDYFNNRIVAVTDVGEVATITKEGVMAKIWDSTIAGDLPGNPAGWSDDFDTVDFVPFRDTMVIHNGVDKPISIKADFSVQYLQDESSGSNANVPIGRYGCTVSNYHCVAGLPNLPTTIYISNSGTSGVFPNDADPNDSISIDVGAYAPEGAEAIRGIAGFRSFLLVFFQAQTLVVKLGEYDEEGNHKPDFPDTMPKFGLLGHRCIQQLENDIIFCGLYGMASAKRNLFSNMLDSQTLSEYIEPAYKRETGAINDINLLQDTFMVYDSLGNKAELHLPQETDLALVYTFNDKLRYRSWSEFDSMQWDCACTSFLGRVFYGKGMRVYQGGNNVFEGENFHVDRLLDRDDNWDNEVTYHVGDLIFDTDNDKVYKCLLEHESSEAPATFADDRLLDRHRWEEYTGIPIHWQMELPWIEGRDPMKMKQLRFVSIGSKGTAQFALKVYVDNLYKNADGEIIRDPAIQMDFMGNDAPGFTADAGPFGGGRRSMDPRLKKFPVKFKSIKFVLDGTTHKPLTVTSLSFLFSKGGYRR